MKIEKNAVKWSDTIDYGDCISAWQIEEAIQEAINEERDACAKIADVRAKQEAERMKNNFHEMLPHAEWAAEEIAEAIRGRSNCG